MSEERLDGTMCRLIRKDGSEWIVTRFELREGGAWITARRVPSSAGVDDSANGHGNGNGNGNGNASGNGNGHGNGRLVEAPLEQGDRLVWMRKDGTVAWAMKNPTGVGLAWRHDDSRDDDAFFAGDFG